MINPKIKIRRDLSDLIIDGLLVMIFFGIVILVLTQYAKLPNEIPSHFDLSGNPDGSFNKSSILMWPGIAFMTLAIHFIIIDRPHTFNFPMKTNTDNAEKHYRLATSLIRRLNICILSFLFYITYMTIQISLGFKSDIPSYALIAFFITLIGISGWYFKKAFRS